MKFKILRAYEQHDEKLFFIGYLALTAIVSFLFSDLLIDAWEASQAIKPLTRLGILAGFSQYLIPLFIFGIFVGALLLMTVDSKKRWSALILSIGFGIVIYSLITAGQILPSDFNNPRYFAWIGGGALFSIVIGGGLELIRLRSLSPNEFRRAPKLVYYFTLVIATFAIAEIHFVYPEFLSVTSQNLIIQPVSPSVEVNTNGIVVNGLIAIATIGTTRQFINYDADEEFFVLGPPASGKSLLMIGGYLQALERDADKSIRRRESIDPSQDLMELAENLDRDNSEWIVEATGRGEFRNLEFNYVRGQLFPKNVTIGSVDYAGEHLRRIPDALAGDISDPSEELQLLTQGIQQADTLILLVDIERFVNNEGLGISEYFKILEEAGDKGVVVVATKCDILADKFYEEEEASPESKFGSFRQYVEDKLTQSEQFRTLLRQTPDSEIYPVYYKTEFNEDGDRVPIRDESGSVTTVGFEHLLERLGK
jgi:GTPase SAR1 family protein